MPMFNQQSFLDQYGVPGAGGMQAPSGMMFRGLGAAPQPVAPQPSKGDRWAAFAGNLGDTLLALSGNPGAAALAQTHQQDRRLQQQRVYEDARLNRPVVQATGNGGFAVINPVTGEVLNQQAGTPTPHYWETNDGSLGAIGPDGHPQILYKDPTPKVTWTQVDLPNGQKQLIPSINGIPATGAPASTGRPAIGATMADPRMGGAASVAGGPFPLRPLTR